MRRLESWSGGASNSLFLLDLAPKTILKERRSMASAPHPPAGSSAANRRIQEALQLFNELQAVPIADIDDSERIRTSSAPGPSPAVTGSRVSAAPSGVASRSGGQQTSKSSGHIEELKHKVNVADAIMKRLHKKNQELVAQLEASRGASSGGSNSDVVAKLRQDIAARDLQIQELKTLLSVRAAMPSSANSTQALHAQPTGGKIPEAPAVANSSRVLQQLHDAERKRWASQYQAVVDCKLELIAQGESTGKVNKEVKAFFQALKQKVLDDALHYEASRAVMNEALFDAEYKLATLGAQ